MVRENFPEIIEELYSSPPPQTLSHYTSLEALNSICLSKSMFASDVRFLNDAQELQYFGILFEEVLSSLTLSGEESVLRDSIIEWLYTALLERRETGVFALSLSERHDQLSQWRAYTKLRSGVSIGLSGTALAEIAKKNDYVIGKCLYDQAQMERICARMANIMIQLALADGPGDTAIWSIPYGRALSLMVDHVLLIAALFKHPAFEEEAEWRIVSIPTPEFRRSDINFRAGNEYIIPYKNFPLAPHFQSGPINQIVVGPSTNSELSIKSIFMLLQYNFMLAQKFTPLKSKVPLR